MQQVPVLQCTVAPVEGKLCHSAHRSIPVIKPDRLKTAKAQVEQAVKLRKVFSVQGPYPVIRGALRARGWVERRLPHLVQRVSQCHNDEEEDGDAVERVDEGEKEEKLDDMYDLISHLVRNETAYFYWTTRRDDIDCSTLRNDQMTNHYANAGTFTTKVGLCVNLRNLQWFDTADPDTFFPRCYRLGAEDERHAFIEDFRRTACTSLLQYVVETSGQRRNGAQVQGADMEDAAHQFVGQGVIDMALNACQEFLSALDHSDIDVTMETPSSVKDQQWSEFLQHYYMIVHEGAPLKGNAAFVQHCQATISRLQQVCPQLDTDGVNNIWIIKPGAKSRGRGIVCMNRLDDILALVDSDRALTKESKWVVQKYLERPLLVYGTKFDIRQWFLVTDWNPLTVWFYRDCYLRFSTQPFSTKSLHSSVHLCNNSIQKHFQPSLDRHPGVPEDNMWSCSQFRVFLQQQGREAEWESAVVPGMQQAVIRALQTTQDLVEPRKASFELYGADFMLGRNLRPWLLEINASPTMACSTAVTARLCPAVQLDTLRVVLDWRTDPHAYTGGFQMIYKQAAVVVPQYLGVNLLVEGAPVRCSRPPSHLHRAIYNRSLTRRLPSEKADMVQKSSDINLHRFSALGSSGKQNQAVQEPKLQLPSLPPTREHERKITNWSSCHRVYCSSASEHTLLPLTEPQKNTQRLSFISNEATLRTRCISLTFNPLHSTPQSKAHPSQPHVAHVSRFFLPCAAFKPQHSTLTPTCLSTCKVLPALKVASLPSSILSVTSRDPEFSDSRRRRSHLFICSHSEATCKGESTVDDKR
ncbi:tubulin monoglycylase TTLL3 [Thalassophryne amazonica]|uniref:tubulin monoglycylase TTLL3 n=1 Tax=Thalassophryne amazonica TaxID=390379 RepID=UPI0014724AE7|nr:tubulin monoglycylase TTLL3 [Thalassophryne amazonica]